MSNTHLGHYYGPAPSNAELGIGTTRLRTLLDAARSVVMTPEDREAQRRSFAFGNVSLSNPAVNRELVDRVADEMQRKCSTCLYKQGGGCGHMCCNFGKYCAFPPTKEQ